MFTLNTIKSLFNQSPNPYLILLPDAPRFTIAEVNPAFLAFTNKTRGDIIGKGIFEAFPENPDNQNLKGLKTIKASLEHALLLKKPHKVAIQRYDLENADRYDVRFWSFDTFPLLDENGQVQLIVQNPVDITGSVMSQPDQATPDKENTIANFQSSLVNDYPDAVFSLDLKGNFLNANKALLDLAECSKEELLKTSFIPFVAPEDFEKVFGYFQKAIHGEIQNYDANFISAGGTHCILNITNLPIIINQQVIGVHVIAKDITVLKETERQLREYHKRISDILESTTDGFYAVDGDWTVTYWNREAERLLFMSREDVIGRNLWEVYPDAVALKFYPEYQRVMSEKQSARFEEYFPALNIWVEVAAFPSADGLSVYFKDITERKNTEQQLTIEKEKYQSLFNLSPIPKWLYDIETLQFLDVNEAAVKHYGYSREEFLSMTIKDIRPPEDIPKLEEILVTKVKNGVFSRSSVRHVKKSGEVISVSVESNSINFDDKIARQILAIDTTEKLKIEQALEVSEQRFKALVQEGSDLIAIVDSQGNYNYVSPTSKSILGTDPEFFIGKNAFDFIHPEDKERIINQFSQLSSRKRIKIAPFRFVNPGKHLLWIETVITDMSDDPAVGGIVANSRDVTQRIKNELQVKESINRYDVVSKATSDAIWDLDIRSGKVLWNKAINGIFGYKELHYTQEWWYNCVHPDDVERVFKTYKRLLQNKQSKLQVEYRFRCADGTYKHVLDRSFLLFDETGEPARMIGALQDITEKMNQIQAVEEQNKKLQEIAWIQSHMVRAPLARILGVTDLLCDNKEEELSSELLSHLKISAAELDYIIRDIVKKTDEI